MSENIDYDMLLNSIEEQIDENDLDSYNFESLLKTAELCWDNTAIQIKSVNFTMIFDLISYECLSYDGFDINE